MKNFINGFKFAQETEAYRNGVKSCNAQPGNPYRVGTVEFRDFVRGQEDGVKHNRVADEIRASEQFAAESAYHYGE